MKQYLQAFNILTKEEIDEAVELAEPKIIKKNDFFIREGQVCKEVAFVKTGFFRSYYHNEISEEVTYCLAFSGAFVAAFSSFITQERSAENICAMADAEVLSLPRKEIIRLENTSSNWLRLNKIIAEQEYLKMEHRVFLLKQSAESRYRDLLINHPQYLQQVPLHHLATFLGVTQRHLSRIRQSVRN